MFQIHYHIGEKEVIKATWLQGPQSSYSGLFYSRLCPSTAGSSPPPESSIFLCPLLSLSILLPVAPQCQLSNDTGLPTDLTPFIFMITCCPLSPKLYWSLEKFWVRGACIKSISPFFLSVTIQPLCRQPSNYLILICYLICVSVPP